VGIIDNVSQQKNQANHGANNHRWQGIPSQCTSLVMKGIWEKGRITGGGGRKEML
jgi:hypothetical protein